MTSDANTPHPTTITTPSETEIRIERVFDAPRELVWEAYTDPELLCGWLGPHRLQMTVQEMDVRSGGAYRYTHSDGDGSYFFFGEFLEVEPPRLLVQTFNFEGNADDESVDRVEFEEIAPDRTRLVITGNFKSVEARDGMLRSGMEKGVNEGYEALDRLLVQLVQVQKN
ncbi:MAG TPA: SRPBCC family protein [Solirubrobacterales bacterium]|nr:SRPBCC family protein [Solirubrobacterales bacterium]